MIQQPRKPDAIPRLEAWRNGERLSGAKLNRGIDAVNRLTQGLRPVRQIRPMPRGKKGAGQAIRVRFQIMGDDHIEGLNDEEQTVFVAKPWLLRRTPFDSEVPDPPPLRGGVKYEYTDGATRQGIIEGDPDADPPILDETEDQIIIQQFFPGDVVYADKQDNTGVVIIDPDGIDPPMPVTLLMHDGSRSFAKVSGSSNGTAAASQPFDEGPGPSTVVGTLTPPITVEPAPGPFTPIDPALRVPRPAITLVGVSELAVPSPTDLPGSHSGPLIFNKPSGVRAGDVMIAYFGGVPVIGRPEVAAPGWIPILPRIITAPSPQYYSDTYYKVATADEPSTYEWPGFTSQGTTGAILAYRGVDPLDPIDTQAGGPNFTGRTFEHRTPSIITSSDNSLVLVLYGLDRQCGAIPCVDDPRSIQPPSGFTKRFEAHAWDNFSMGADFTQVRAGPTGEFVAVESPQTTMGTAIILALRGVRT